MKWTLLNRLCQHLMRAVSQQYLPSVFRLALRLRFRRVEFAVRTRMKMAGQKQCSSSSILAGYVSVPAFAAAVLFMPIKILLPFFRIWILQPSCQATSYPCPYPTRPPTTLTSCQMSGVKCLLMRSRVRPEGRGQ